MDVQPGDTGRSSRTTAGDAPVSRDEAYETSRLVVELLHAAHASRRDDSGRADDPPRKAATAPDRGPADHRHDTPPSDHAIRAAIYLYQHGGGTVGRLAAGLGVSRGWASRVVDELVTRGHVAREQDPTDRRVVNLRLTTLALDEIERAYRWRGDVVAAALAEHPAAAREAIRAFLRRVAAGLARGEAGES